MPTTITTDTQKDRPPPKRGLLVLAILAAVSCIALIVAIVWYEGAPGRAASTIGGPFTLTSSNGQMVTERSFPGKYLLVYFGYTFCPDVCPTTMADLAIALKALGAKADAVQPLFMTVDPARDTPEVLKAYVAQFSPRLLGLTGTPNQIAAVEKQYKVYAEIHRTGTGAGDYQVDHSSVFYLIAPDGNFVTVIAADQQGSAIAADLKQYLP